MGVRGPKPQPTALRVAGGLDVSEKSAARTEAAKAEPLPSAPAWLLPEAKVEWRRLGPKLHGLGLLSMIDRGSFAALCQAYGVWSVAEKELAAIREQLIAEAAKEGKTSSGAGMVATTATGNLVHHPLVSIAAKARGEYVKISVEFGLTPSSRSRIDTDAAKNRGSKSGASRFFNR